MGGSGVVHKQTQKTTGHYRAVKTIDKRLLHKLDYSGELLVMAILAKVGVRTHEGIFPIVVYHPYVDLLLWSNGQLCQRLSLFPGMV